MSTRLKVLIVISTVIISSASLIYNKIKTERKEVVERMALEKENFKVIDNPFYIDKEISNGNDVQTTLVFLKNKFTYLKSIEDFDNGQYEEAIKRLNEITNENFFSLKYDLMGDINTEISTKESYIKALDNYKKAYSYTSNKNTYLKDAIYSKILLAQKNINTTKKAL